jgi:hypothetical protein
MLIYSKENKNNKPLDPNSIQTSSTVVFITIGMDEPKIIDLQKIIEESQKRES